MEENKIFIKTNPKIVCREEDDGALLFNVEDGSIKVLNFLGYKIWKLFNGNFTLEDIINKIESEYPSISKEVIKKDIKDFVEYLKKVSLVEFIVKT